MDRRDRPAEVRLDHGAAGAELRDVVQLDEADPESLKATTSFSEAFKKPFDIALLAERIRTLAAEKRED